MQIGKQNDASTTNKVGIFKLKLKFSGAKNSCLLPVYLLIFSRWHIFKCRFKGIKQIKYLTIFQLGEQQELSFFNNEKHESNKKDVAANNYFAQ